MTSKFSCPVCSQPLTKEHFPRTNRADIKPYVQVYCQNPKCISVVAASDGGSGPSEEAAYRSLCLAVDNETERECEPWDGESDVDRKERIAMEKADRDRKRSVGL